MTFYAHSLEGRSTEEWQPLDEHLQNVAEMAAEFAEVFESAEWARNAGWFHDLGKATNAFQSYLHRCNELDDSAYDTDGSVSNHASTGAAWAIQKCEKCVGKILAYLSAGHHAGLPDWHTNATGNAALSIRLQEGQTNLEYIRDYAQQLLSSITPPNTPPSFLKSNLPGFHLWIRMLFSCLVDADFLDTERFVAAEQSANRAKFLTIPELSELFFKALDMLESSASKSPVNAIRSEIRQTCEAAAASDPGLFSLSVPTGGGKTLSAMAFALRHALKHGMRRIIYVIPYTSIIEQTVEILAGIFGYENVVEHHSNVAFEKETPRLRMAAENWDAPIIVTTSVQFYESLFSARTSSCRKLHNIPNTVVILDEAQLLPPKWLNPCVSVMNQLVSNYRVTMLMATATQPVLPELLRSTQITPESMSLYDRLRRTDITFPENLEQRSEWTDIAEKLKKHDQVLCVVNTRKDCYELFKLMPEGTVHLSALMCGQHRSAVIRLIKNRLKLNLPIRVISTQLVEAGVDIDFPVVYRAIAGLDSIAQAAGRCNREGKLNESGTLGQVHVFLPPKASPPGILRKGEDKTREMSVMPGFDPQNPDSFSTYFKLFYSAVNDTGQNWIRERLIKDVNPHLFFQFRTAGHEFRFIEDQDRVPVLVRYKASRKWLRALQLAGPTREILRKLQRYTVNISKRDFGRAKTDGLIEELSPDVWCWAPTYDRAVGLDIFGTGWESNDLIV